ncbi:MAG: ABC transporter substrate-binding protein [Deltaproteobacteria bacterium]|nr:ABC transporter substrate-binding protein [Deltaproteobacteria bacterium]
MPTNRLDLVGAAAVMNYRLRLVGAIILMFLLATPVVGSAGQAITLGVPTSLQYVEGRESLDAVKLAAEEINLAGGVKIGTRRLPIRVTAVDLKDADPEEEIPVILSRLEKFLDQNKPDAILVGPFRSEVILAGMDVIADRRVPFLGTIAMTPAIESKILANPHYDNIFRVGLNTKYLADFLIDYMKFLRTKFGFNKVFIMNQDVAWSRTTSSQLMKLYFTRAGWEILGQENYPSSTSDFSIGLAKAGATGAQVILSIFDHPSSGALALQWHQLGIPALLVGYISPMVGSRAWATYKHQIDGAMLLVYELGDMPSRCYPPATKFYENFRRKYGREIEAGHGPAPAYESVYLLVEAMEKAGTLDPAAVVAAIKKTDRQGTMGRLRFHQGGQIIFGRDPQQEAVVCLFQWTPDGRRKIIFPEALAEAEVFLPSFIKPTGR